MSRPRGATSSAADTPVPRGAVGVTALSPRRYGSGHRVSGELRRRAAVVPIDWCSWGDVRRRDVRPVVQGTHVRHRRGVCVPDGVYVRPGYLHAGDAYRAHLAADAGRPRPDWPGVGVSAFVFSTGPSLLTGLVLFALGAVSTEKRTCSLSGRCR
ncbi:hypothetical protein C8039_02500 [Halogeometricum sp. wsp3]|nr:hypothetical protein C8039_02500 [Halogeometricum sp. wsp3]